MTELKRMLGAVLGLGASVVLAAPPVTDAFLSRRDARPLVEARELQGPSRAALATAHVTSTEPRYGVPTFLWAARPASSGPSLRDQGVTAEEAARRHLVTHAPIYRAEASRWAEARVAHVHDLGDGSAVIVSFHQRPGGVRVFRDELKVIMTSRLELVALSGYLTPQTKALGEFALTSAAAVQSAWVNLTGVTLEDSRLTSKGRFGGGYEHFRIDGVESPVRTRETWFPTPDGLLPGYYVELDLPGEGAPLMYSYVVSASDGALLYRKDLTASHSYRVWADPVAPYLPLDGPQGSAATPHPTGNPDSFDPGTATQSLVTLTNAGLSTNDPWLPAGATETNGNNVYAYADLVSRNGFTAGSDVIGTTSSADTFDYTYDFLRGPGASAAQRQSAIVQLFYDNNLFHDWFYDVGFNEAAGNAQANNLGRGGLGNDVLRAEAQDYSGLDNANMSTPSDGANPRMQMYLFEGAGQLTLTANTQPTAQTFTTAGAQFGPSDFNLTGEFVLINDGDATPTDGCGATWNAAVAGKIALIDRGTCTFLQKAQNAQANGAVGVIIANNQGTNSAPDLVGTGTVAIPAVSTSLTGGNALKALPAGTTVTLFRQTSLDRDGTLDNGVVAHEWGHFISNRLIGDGNGISNLQARGMGEGWGDFHAALVIARAADAQVATNTTWNGVYSLSGWASFAADPNGYYYGFRRYPLSTDLNKNPLTFRHIADGVRLPMGIPVAFGSSGTDNSEVHATGEVWAVILWEVYATLLRDSRYTFQQAQDLMRAYLVGAYKATPLMPNFVEARDAVLAMAAARDPQDFSQFWAAFARRGMGMGAVAPDRDSQSNSPVTESFTVGNAVTVTQTSVDDSTTSCDGDGLLDANEAGRLVITVRNTGTGPVTQAVVSVTSGTPGVTVGGGGSIALPSTPPFGAATVELPISLADVAGVMGGMLTITITDSSFANGPMTHQAMFRLNYDVRPMGSTLDDVEAPTTTWTSGHDPALPTGSTFRIFQSSATEHFWFGPNPSSAADTYLVSPPLQVGQQPFGVSFKHRFDFERDTNENYDGAVLELSTNNGSSWTDIGGLGFPGYTGTLTTSQNQSENPLRGRRAWVTKSANYPTFNQETIDLGTLYAGQTVRLRFRVGADEAAAAKGWELDDIRLTGITNRPFALVVSDPNTCTNGAPTATIGADQEVNEGDLVTLVGGGTDPDGDPVTLSWTQTGGPMVTLADGTFTAPEVTADTPVLFELTVSDGRAVTLPLEVTVLVKNVNRAPIATAPALLEANMGEIVTVLGTGGDPEGDPLTYEWTQVGGPEVALQGAASDTLIFTAPAVLVEETIRLQLVVRDPTLASAPAFVDVVVKNPTPMTNVNPPKACGCSGLEAGLAVAGALVLLLRRRRGP